MSAQDEKKAPRDVDEHFVLTALQRGLLTETQVEECRSTQQGLLKSGQRRTLADIAAEKTLVTQSQAERIERENLPTHVPKTAGSYEIIRQIGEGGMGTVYKARHTKLGSYAAVKFLPARLAEDASFVQRFEREARLAAQLTSPFSVRTFDVGEAEGARCIFMEYVEGESLDELLHREGRTEERRALAIIRDVASALDEAHELGIIHRDIKPANILISRRGAPRLADLGLAKDIESGQASLTSLGAILGTPSYMSPEQAMGLPDLDARTDIYSLGATLYRMVVGDVPFRGETPVNVMHKIATDPLTAPIERNPALSRETGAMICKMMAKDRKDRYQSMAELIKDIETILSGQRTGLNYEKSVILLQPEARPARPGSGLGSGRRKVKAAFVAAGAVALAVLGFFAVRPLLSPAPPARRAIGPLTPTTAPAHVVALGPTTQPKTTHGPKTTTEPKTTREPKTTTEPKTVTGPSRPAVTASSLMAQAAEAAGRDQWEQARTLAQQVLDQFPGAAESARAAELVETAVRETTVQELMRLAVTGEPVATAARVAEARKRWPGEKRISGLQQVTDARLEKAYNDTIAQATAAEKKLDFAAAIAAYEAALKFRETDDGKAKLKSARLSQKLAEAGQVKQVAAKLLAVADALQKGGNESTRAVQAEILELIAARSKAVAALGHAGRFQERMAAELKARFALGEEKFTRSEKTLEALQPLAMVPEALRSVKVALTEADEQLTGVASAAFGALYSGVEEQLGKSDFAAGLLRLHDAKQRYPDYPGVAQLLHTYDPDGSGLAIAALTVATGSRASDYASPKEAASACAALDEAWRRCEAFTSKTDHERKATSLKVLVLSRRAVARSAAGAPLEAMADASAAADLAGDDRRFRDLLSTAAAAGIDECGRAIKAGKTTEFLEKTGALLGGKPHAAARLALGAAMGNAPFLKELMREPGLVSAWVKTIAPFQPAGMAAIPKGTFPLGLAYDGLVTLAPSNSPEHPVTLAQFFIDVREVTNEEFQQFVTEGGYAAERWWDGIREDDRKAFVDTTGRPAPKLWRDGRFPDGKGKHPAAGVSCYEAAAYARWAGKRLATEAEWECAALGSPLPQGQALFQKRAFPWGETYAEGLANLQEARIGTTEAAGTRQKDISAFGCIDMTGNVREWTSSPYGPYPGTKCQDKNFGKGLISVRGASFADSYIGAAPTTRRAAAKTTRDECVGFRCAWSFPAAQDRP